MRKNLFSIGADAKTIKGQKLGFLTGILYMAPAAVSGYNVCAMAAAASCEKACLYRAGLGGVYTSVQNARIAKARAYFENRTEFMRDIAYSIGALIHRAMIIGAIPLVRLNGTSDIRYENTPVDIDADTARDIKRVCGFVVPVGQYSNIMEVFPEIQFYDYSKLCNRSDLPKNYDLTFSYSGVISFQRYVNIALQNGMRIAAVFRTRESIPAQFLGLECIDGDDSDVRHIEPRGVIVALYAKGPAKKDTSGFVVDSGARVIPLRTAA
jgi:hypothetical protein